MPLLAIKFRRMQVLAGCARTVQRPAHATSSVNCHNAAMREHKGAMSSWALLPAGAKRGAVATAAIASAGAMSAVPTAGASAPAIGASAGLRPSSVKVPPAALGSRAGDAAAYMSWLPGRGADGSSAGTGARTWLGARAMAGYSEPSGCSALREAIGC